MHDTPFLAIQPTQIHERRVNVAKHNVSNFSQTREFLWLVMSSEGHNMENTALLNESLQEQQRTNMGPRGVLH